MSELSLQSWTMPAASLGAKNPLPPLFQRRPPLSLDYPPDTPGDLLENMSYGHIASCLPYTMQDSYERQLHPTEFRVAVLENEFLRATFLVEFGGRLWSLFHKPSKRELLEVNPVFQLANLAIRNAWFSGGVEWNIGTIGHSPLTCSPMFSCRVEGTDGTPILRLYEWERFRQVPFQIDAYLPDGSPVLFIRVRIINSNEQDVPIYWWSNIAVPEHTGTRVIAPADSAYCLGCEPNQLVRIPIPLIDGMDVTYSANLSQARDFFFEIPVDQRPWITALDGEGKGLVQVSTDQMVGRKLWVWGTGPGGHNWQRFLSPPGAGYIEIQAGLTRTQLEHLRMPVGAEWSWLEAYGLLETDPRIVHGSNWLCTQQHIEDQLAKLISSDALSTEFVKGTRLLNTPPVEIYLHGSGWGALERRRREKFGEPSIFPDGLDFNNDSLTDEQAPWIALLEDGSFPTADPESPPNSFVVGAKWRDLLERWMSDGKGENWLARFHLGVIHHHAGDRGKARESWGRSMDLEWTPWVARSLAILAWEAGKLDEASDLLVKACCAAPELLPLAVECGQCLIEARKTRQWIDLLMKLPQSVRNNGRVRLLEAQARLLEGELARVKEFLDERVIPCDLREGEDSLTNLWYTYHEQRLSTEEGVPIDMSLRHRVKDEFPVPQEIDFRMGTG